MGHTGIADQHGTTCLIKWHDTNNLVALSKHAHKKNTNIQKRLLVKYKERYVQYI